MSEDTGALEEHEILEQSGNVKNMNVVSIC